MNGNQDNSEAPLAPTPLTPRTARVVRRLRARDPREIMRAGREQRHLEDTPMQSTLRAAPAAPPIFLDATVSAPEFSAQYVPRLRPATPPSGAVSPLGSGLGEPLAALGGPSLLSLDSDDDSDVAASNEPIQRSGQRVGLEEPGQVESGVVAVPDPSIADQSALGRYSVFNQQVLCGSALNAFRDRISTVPLSSSDDEVDGLVNRPSSRPFTARPPR